MALPDRSTLPDTSTLLARGILRACLAVCLAPWPLAAQAGQIAGACGEPSSPVSGPQLHVVASGARSDNGNISFTLYGDNAARFLKPHGSIALTRVGLAGRGAEACFGVSSPGSVAVAIFHDENNNHHFDRNFLGLPSEGYGFSNNPAILFGPPSFKAARVTLRMGDNRIFVRLHY